MFGIRRRVRDRVDLTRGDLRVLGDALRGKRRPSFETRGRNEHPQAERKAIAGAVRVRVASIERETDRAVTIGFPAGAIPAFEAGQFLTLSTKVGGETLRRAYSISCAQGSEEVTITCKRVEGGRMSTYLTSALEVGDELDVLGPSGSFVLDDRKAPLVFIAAGSGITPVRSLIETALQNTKRDIALVYGNRSRADTIFCEELEALARSSERLSIYWVSEAGDLKGKQKGRLDRALLSNHFDRIARKLTPKGARKASFVTNASFYICGPTPVLEGAQAELSKRGAEHVHVEVFVPPRTEPKSIGGPQSLRIVGQPSSFILPAGETVLEGALAAGAELPFSCAVGGCAACKVKLVSGEVRMSEPNCLTSEERAEGYVLTCVGTACSPITLEIPSDA